MVCFYLITVKIPDNRSHSRISTTAAKITDSIKISYDEASLTVVAEKWVEKRFLQCVEKRFAINQRKL